MLDSVGNAKKQTVTELGQRVKALRKARGITQEVLVERAGLHRSTIAFIETGRTQSLDSDTLIAVATVLDVSLEDLTGSAPNAKPIAQAVQEFQASDWGKVTKATESELVWLRSLSPSMWIGYNPTPESLHYLVLARRKADPVQLGL